MQMKSLLRLPARPAVLVLLLTGIISGRLSIGLPFDTLTSLERVVTHPSKLLDKGVYVTVEAQRKLPIIGRRRMLPTTEDPFQAKGFHLKGSDVTRTLSDSGGSLQLLLLLLLCAAVLCCASMSISPWYKSDSYVIRKALGVLHAALSATAFVFEGMSSRQSAQPGTLRSSQPGEQEAGRCCEPGSEGKGQKIRGAEMAERPNKGTPQHVVGHQRKVRSKKRKGGGHAQLLYTASGRPLEKTLSSGNSSVYEVSSTHSGDMEGEPASSAAREERECAGEATPADLQIARLEAEAAGLSSQRAGKNKRSGKKQAATVEASPVEDLIGKQSQGGSLADCGSRKSERSSSSSTISEKSVKPLLGRKNGGKEVAATGARSQKPAKASLLAEGELRDRLGRRILPAEKSSARLSQVLVVPRRPAHRNHQDQGRPHRSLSDDERDTSLAPGTPERAASTCSTFSSPHSSVFSPTNPSRPYAQVAKESSKAISMARMTTPPPPPPPPPPRVGALPQSAVYAREFRPALGSAKPALDASAPVFSPSGQRRPSPLAPPPAHVAFLQIQSPGRPCSTTSPLPSPFPGMSLHRRLVSPSHQPLAPGWSEASSQVESNGQSSSPVFRGLGFPGVFDTIWSRSAVGAESAWQPIGSSQAVSGSLESGRALLSSLEDTPKVNRQDSW